MKWEKKEKREKVEIFNFKSKSGQQKFKDMTSRKGVLSDIFKNEEMDLASMTKKFMKKIIRILHQCFDKVRVKDNVDKEITNLFDKRRSLRSKTDSNSKKELLKVEEKLADKCAKNNYLKIKEELKGMESEAEMHPGKLWKLKKKLSPKSMDPPTVGSLWESSHINGRSRKTRLEPLPKHPRK